MGRMDGKMALVTGGAQGLGAASASMLAREGAKVAISDLNLDGAQEIAIQINQTHGPKTAFAYQHDVAKEDDWVRIIEQAENDMQGLNVLVNNAGIGSIGNVETETLESFQRVMAVDVDSIFLGCKYAIPVMRKYQPGSIVNISSIAGLIASENYVAYNAAKSAVWMMSKSIALHCAKSAPGLRCNSIHPTFINTPILDGVKSMFGEKEGLDKLARQVPLGRVGEPDDIAYAVLYLASDESKFVTGAELKVDGGISAR